MYRRFDIIVINNLNNYIDSKSFYLLTNDGKLQCRSILESKEISEKFLNEQQFSNINLENLQLLKVTELDRLPFESYNPPCLDSSTEIPRNYSEIVWDIGNFFLTVAMVTVT